MNLTFQEEVGSTQLVHIANLWDYLRPLLVVLFCYKFIEANVPVICIQKK